MAELVSKKYKVNSWASAQFWWDLAVPLSRWVTMVELVGKKYKVNSWASAQFWWDLAVTGARWSPWLS